MPLYEYKCKNCSFVTEINQDINDDTEFLCPDCYLPLKRVFTPFHISHKNSKPIQDKQSQHQEMKQELNDDYGVESVVPLGGNNIESIYQDVKSQGNYVKEQMHQNAEQKAKEQKEKRKSWKHEALKRAPYRAQVKREKREQEKQEKRKINL